MTTSSKKTWVLVDNKGESREITGTRVESNQENLRVQFFDGDEVVASFIGYQSFFPKA